MIEPQMVELVHLEGECVYENDKKETQDDTSSLLFQEIQRLIWRIYVDACSNIGYRIAWKARNKKEYKKRLTRQKVTVIQRGSIIPNASVVNETNIELEVDWKIFACAGQLPLTTPSTGLPRSGPSRTTMLSQHCSVSTAPKSNLIRYPPLVDKW
ncbi:hypothetical protein GCK72_017706 [Caenorhabditis remanei]|uniref:Uncharacterized protein n=1 Tax=Caenorhabditis remanei TaxID=31234 RepID=A0A6A5G990_CAERE|nr:hypothetical protein GCK72_017706 [Caenorhabditis remanei]KAF1751152.1 hypothetical protein GCK72_017706 [Caenorhabditis remanei]